MVILQEKVSAESYDNWLKGAVYVRTDGATLFVSVPDRETRTILEKEYSALVRSSLQELGLPLEHVCYEVQLIQGARNQALAAVEGGELESDPQSESEIHVRYLCSGSLQPVRACRRAVGGYQPLAQL